MEHKDSQFQVDPQFDPDLFRGDILTEVENLRNDPIPIAAKPYQSSSSTNGAPFDWESLLSSVKVDPLVVVEKPPVIVSMNDAPICTLGNITLLIGKAKSRKTFLLTSVAAAVLIGHCNIDGLICDFPEELDVLYFDNEQGKYHLSKTVNRICIQAGHPCPTNFHAYGLRPFTPAERVGAIEFTVQKLHRPALIIIDGLRDLLTRGINDEAEATVIMSKFLKWTYEKNCHILLVLHQNKNDQNARGHIGTEAVNKAETVLSVQKDNKNKEVTIVTPEFCRDVEFEPFAFIIDSKGLPQRQSMTTLTGDRKSEAIRENLASLLPGLRSMRYHELVEEYCAVGAVAIATAKRHIAFAIKNKTLVKCSSGNLQMKFQPENDIEDPD
ncbi:MAG: AAA family ATPase [bacterium]